MKKQLATEKHRLPENSTQGLCSIFKGARAPTPVREKSVSGILEEIHSGAYKKEIDRCRELLDEDGKDAYSQAKLNLPAVTFSGTFSRRSNDQIITPTGILVADLDNVEVPEKVCKLLQDDPHVLFYFKSPSGKGIKVGVIAEGIENDADHKKFFKAVERYFKQAYGIEIDESCKDISRLCFLSYDPHLHINPEAKPFPITEGDPEPKQRNPHTTTTGSNTGKSLYAWRKIQSCADAIREAQPGHMHITRRSRARLAGGYAHYVDAQKALQDLEKAVRESGTTDPARSLKTVRTFFQYGQEVPIEIEGITGAGNQPPPQRDPEPLPDELLPVEPFDFALLPPTLAPWAEDICSRMQCPPDFVGTGIVTGLGTIIGRKVGIRPMVRDSWTVIVNLWGVVVGRPGLLKTPAVEETLKPIRRLIAVALQEYEEALEEYDKQAETYKQRQSAMEHARKKRLQKDPNADVSDLILTNRRPKPPVLKRYISNDSTPEALGEILRQNPNGVLVFRDELVSLLKGMDREDRVEARGFYLTGWNGDSPYTFDRIGRGLNLHIPALCLSVLGGTQPGRLSEYIHHAVRGGAADDGLIQRFGLLVWPDVSGEWTEVDRWPDAESRDRAFEVYQSLSKLTPESIGAEQDTYGDTIPFLRFSPAAQDMFREWRAKLEGRLRSGELHPALESHLAKYRKLIPALALICHLGDRGTGPVSEEATLRALAWSEYLESHARRAYASAAQPEIAVAKAILRRLQKGDLKSPFSSRDVWRPGWSMLTDRDQVVEALQLLEDYGWITSEQKKDTGGRPSTTYTAHEGVWMILLA